MLSYEGLFFEGESLKLLQSLDVNKLDTINDLIHCTFKYHPRKNEIFNELIGREFEVIIVGYANNGKNSGLEIVLPDELKKYYINEDKKPHITLSIKEGESASNTKDLVFIPLNTQYKVKGKFGFWIKEEEKEYVSFEKYNGEVYER